MNIYDKKYALQEYYYNREYTTKENIINTLYWLLKIIIFILAIFFLYQNFESKIGGLIVFSLFTFYYFLYKEYCSIKYKYYDKVFEYSEIMNELQIDKYKKIIKNSNSIYEIKEKLEEMETE